MAFSTSASLLLIAYICCFIVNAAELKQFFPSVANRQSKQMFYMPSSIFNYYNPYGAQIMVPTAGQIQPEFLSSGGSELAAMEKIMNQNEALTLSPVSTACVITAGYSSPCVASSSAPTGTISVTFTAAAQTVAVAISPKNLFSTRVKFTCTTLTDVAGYSKSAKLTTTGVKEVIENKPALLIVSLLDATKTSGSLKCSWSSLN
ncbi:hypothetical protein DAPPUDRAFT_315118 [Daphnia pulex]|uniref:Uncharacterized protein n=1 Tax=Daphnia pulex TaxID=6669 RepID=E9G8T0_DAPPU|nr:hypothetical protein DAPPUDRAFT_315118 [Daphnia pulex]|eukprot:EFX84026.1 hypothetical protein DAPPUDRAFT_315118 [Daphnia pulex]